jgi:hypothetical protein
MNALMKAPRTHYKVECRDKDGNLKWSDTFSNLVTDEGINDALSKYLKGSAYTAAWYLALVNATPTYAAADTAASHGGWTENSNYAETVRQTVTFGTVASKSVDNSASPAVFTINGAGGTIAGVAMLSSNVKGGTAGVLYAEANFSGGNRIVVALDTLTVTVTATGA